MTERSDRPIERALVEFAQGLIDHQTVESVLQALGDQCTTLLPVSGVGVLLVEEDGLTVATTNSPEGDAAEQLEVELAEGPCVDSVRSGHPVLVPDLAATEGRWPRFVPRALDAGIGAVFGIPMSGRGDLVGSLNIVNREPIELSEYELATAQILADVAVAYIFAVRLHEESSTLARQLQNALDVRVVIEQAKGILSERHGESLAEAFERLRSHARGNRLTVRHVATEVVESRLRV